MSTQAKNIPFLPLTQTQQAIINSIGNKELVGRLFKRTLHIFSRGERLHAIEFYRTHVHVNPLTSERSLSISSASETLHIQGHIDAMH
ncbi:hypothetical protein BDV06DRAFT_184544 [Aspergillus oleicola]